MSKYTILSPVYPTEKCYVSEVLFWRAFGRFPEMAWGDGDESWRFESDALESYKAPIFSGMELSPEETQYADIPPDPRMVNLLSQSYINNPDSYRNFIARFEKSDVSDPAYIDDLQSSLEKAVQQEKKEEEWLPIYVDYVDEFINEILLDLRRGKLTAFGTMMPMVGDSKSNYNTKKWRDWLEDIEWLREQEIVEIPKNLWVSNSVNLHDSTLFSRTQKYVWIFVDTEAMIEIYPPKLLIKQNQLYPVGANFAVTSETFSRPSFQQGLGGRPPLPWSKFHVQVAKMYRDDEMPDKKEAAIVELQDWFTTTIGKPVSRSAIGQKLKPYYDELKEKT